MKGPQLLDTRGCEWVDLGTWVTSTPGPKGQEAGASVSLAVKWNL